MIKRIFLPFSGQCEEIAAVQLAMMLATRLDAEVDALFVGDTVESTSNFHRDEFRRARQAGGTAAAYAALEKIYCDSYGGQPVTAAQSVGALLAKEETAGRWKWTDYAHAFAGGDPTVKDAAVLSDLTVCSSVITSSVRDYLINDVLFPIGRPLLFTSARRFETDQLIPVVAWKPTAQTIHAVTAAMPILRLAGRCHVVAIDEPGPEEASPSVERFAEYLASHGVTGTPVRLPAIDKTEPAQQLLDFAVREQANLIVMGAYSQSRLRQLIFGGFTRHLLKARDISVFMAH